MKLRYKIAFSCVFVMFLLTAVPSQASYDDTAGLFNNFQLVREVFSRSDIGIKDIKLQAWGQISNRLYSLNELKEKYQILAKGLQLDSQKPAIQVERDGFTGISLLSAKEEGETCQLSIQAVPEPGNPGEGATYLAILFTTSDQQRASQVYGDLLPLLQEIGFQEPLGVTFTGSMSGQVSSGIQKAMVRSLASAVRAEYIEGIVQDRYTSVSFYSRMGTGFLNVQGRKINLNIALSCDEQENKTYLNVGAPLIYQDY